MAGRGIRHRRTWLFLRCWTWLHTIADPPAVGELQSSVPYAPIVPTRTRDVPVSMVPIPEGLARALETTYRLEREIGRGGMATVYLAEDLKHRRKVAVKVLHPELAAAIGPTRFVREIEIAAQLTHPHILMLIDSGEADGHLFYVMPFVDGESLQDRLKREGTLPLHEAVRLMDQVASALSHAHAHDVIHRDVKPANILLAGDQAIVADFGIARAVQAAGGPKLTGTGMALGTPAYMSPEQAFDQKAVDGRTDVYSMGCMLFEMLTGKTPFESKTAMALLAKHVAEKPPSLRAIDPTTPLFVERAVSRALAKDPSDRFESPNAFADTLRSETVVAPVGRKRIAVLPPANIGDDPDRQYLVLGLHEALISQVGRGDIAVLARTSVLQYQDTDHQSAGTPLPAPNRPGGSCHAPGRSIPDRYHPDHSAAAASGYGARR